MNMKKTMLFIMIAALAISFAGCTAAAAELPDPTAAPSVKSDALSAAETAAPAETAESQGRLVVTFASESEDYYTDDGEQLLLQYSCVVPSVTIDRRPDAEAAVNAALDAEYVLFSEGDKDQEGPSGREGFLNAARDEYALRQEYGGEADMPPYSLERSVDVTRGDDRVLRLFFTDSTYIGGVHGYAFHWAMNFDTVTGEELTLADLGKDDDFLAAAADRLFDVAGSAEYLMVGFFEDYRDYLPDLLRDGNWYFGEEGLTVIANAYEIAPYASGTIEFTLPWAWLQWRVKPEYIPENTADGTLTGEIADEAPADASFVLDDGTDGMGAPVVLTARGRVENVSLTRVSYMEYVDAFMPEQTVWYASALEDGETVCLRTWIPEILPDLALTRTEETGTVTDYISQSGKDGSLVLLPERDFLFLPAEVFDKIPLEYDIDGDGERETVDLRHTSTPSSSQWEVLVDGEPLPGALNIWGECELWLGDADSDGVTEIFLSGDQGSDDYATRGWKGDTGQMILFTGDDRHGRDPNELTETTDGRIVFSGWAPVLESWIYRLGTYYSARAMELSEDGVLAPADGTRWEYRRNDRWLTVESNLPVTMDEVGRAVLVPGTKLLLTSMEGDVVRFVTEEGETGSIVTEFVYGSGWFIDGVKEDEYFEFLPYAG